MWSFTAVMNVGFFTHFKNKNEKNSKGNLFKEISPFDGIFGKHHL